MQITVLEMSADREQQRQHKKATKFHKLKVTALVLEC